MKLNKYIASMYIGLSLVSQNLLMYCHLSRKQNQSPKINFFLAFKQTWRAILQVHEFEFEFQYQFISILMKLNMYIV